MLTDEKHWCVYIHTAPDGKKYVGITCNKPEWRWRNGKGYSQNAHFSAAIQKYGWGNFTHEIVASGLPKADACEMEQRLIKLYKTQDREYGYNKSSGGELSALGVIGRKHTEGTRQRMSEARKKVVLTPDWRKHLSEALTGTKQSEERKHNTSVTMKCLWENPDYRAKMVEAHSNENSHKARRVLCVETGEIFECIKYACQRYGVHSSSVSNVCRGKLKTTGGYHWQYVE